MKEKLTLKEIFDLSKKYFSYRITHSYRDDENCCIKFCLYDSFVFGFTLEKDDSISASLFIIDKVPINRLFNRDIATNNDRESIFESLELIDKYCRLRLTDKYLEEYESSLKTKK